MGTPSTLAQGRFSPVEKNSPRARPRLSAGTCDSKPGAGTGSDAQLAALLAQASEEPLGLTVSGTVQPFSSSVPAEGESTSSESQTLEHSSLHEQYAACADIVGTYARGPAKLAIRARAVCRMAASAASRRLAMAARPGLPQTARSDYYDSMGMRMSGITSLVGSNSKGPRAEGDIY